MDIKTLAEQYNDYIIDRRRYYHTCPELSGEEKNTIFQVNMEAATEIARTTKGVQKVVRVFEYISEEEARRLDGAAASTQ